MHFRCFFYFSWFVTFVIWSFKVTSIGGLKWNFPRGFNPLGQRSFQNRGNNRNATAGRGKKTQMKVNIVEEIREVSYVLLMNVWIFGSLLKATAKKKTAVKKNKENEKKENKSQINADKESSDESPWVFIHDFLIIDVKTPLAGLFSGKCPQKALRSY